MIHLKASPSGNGPTPTGHLLVWEKFLPATASVLLLTFVCTFLTSIVAAIGLFPTLFLATVATACVVMQIGELATPRSTHV